MQQKILKIYKQIIDFIRNIWLIVKNSNYFLWYGYSVILIIIEKSTIYTGMVLPFPWNILLFTFINIIYIILLYLFICRLNNNLKNESYFNYWLNLFFAILTTCYYFWFNSLNVLSKLPAIKITAKVIEKNWFEKFLPFQWNITLCILIILFYIIFIYFFAYKLKKILNDNSLPFHWLYLLIFFAFLPYYFLLFNIGGNMPSIEIIVNINESFWQGKFNNKNYTIDSYKSLENMINAPEEYHALRIEELVRIAEELQNKIAREIAEKETFQKMVDLYNSIKLDADGRITPIVNTFEYNAYYDFRRNIIPPEDLLPIRLPCFRGKCQRFHYDPVFAKNIVHWQWIFYNILSDPRIQALNIDWQNLNISSHYKGHQIARFYPEIIKAYVHENDIIMDFNNRDLGGWFNNGALPWEIKAIKEHPHIFERDLEKLFKDKK